MDENPTASRKKTLISQTSTYHSNKTYGYVLVAYEVNHAAGLVVKSESQNRDDSDNENVEGNGDKNGRGNGNENRGGNGNENPNRNDRGAMPVTRECTYRDFVKCQSLNFKGTKGVVRMTRWFEKMETIFHISNYPEMYQFKYSTCTLLNGALTWWNLHKRTIGPKAAFSMSWRELIKLMTEGNMIAAEPTRLHDVIRITNNLIDQKFKGYAARSVENKRRVNNNQKENRVQQPLYKRQNVGGQRVARAYTA
nr:hypothetical protein [Tanacetum cinerariifolium]